MASRSAKKEIGAASGNVDLAHERSSGVYRTAKAFTPFAVMLVGWLLFWLVSLRLLFVHERYLDLVAGAGLMMLPFVGILGWMAWKAHRMEHRQR